jgi:uncharacterized protein YjiS (DUF1127 family)
MRGQVGSASGSPPTDVPSPMPALISRLSAIARRRRTIAELNDLSNEQLRDIGINRRDIPLAVAVAERNQAPARTPRVAASDALRPAYAG